MADDPRKGHPGFTPTDPPPEKRMQGVRLPPLKEETPMKTERGEMQVPPTGWQSVAADFMKKWSPGGVAFALLLIFFGVGGKDFVKEVVLANEQNRKLTEAVTACTASTQALTQQLQVTSADVDAIKVSQQAANASISDNRKNLGNLCEVFSMMNGGRPHESWCYGEDGRSPGFVPLPPDGKRAQMFLVTTPWADSRAK